MAGQQLDPSLQAQLGGSGGMPTQKGAAEQQAKMEQERQMREELLQKLLTVDAKERLNRIKVVKPDRARQLEDMVINMGRKGQLQSALDDKQLKNMLESISGGGEPEKRKVVIARRMDDSDSDVDLDGL